MPPLLLSPRQQTDFRLCALVGSAGALVFAGVVVVPEAVAAGVDDALAAGFLALALVVVLTAAATSSWILSMSGFTVLITFGSKTTLRTPPDLTRFARSTQACR